MSEVKRIRKVEVQNEIDKAIMRGEHHLSFLVSSPHHSEETHLAILRELSNFFPPDKGYEVYGTSVTRAPYYFNQPERHYTINFPV